MNLQTGRPYLWHGITWATGTPTLLMVDTATAVLGQVDVIGLNVGLKVIGPTRYCTGRYGFAGTFAVEPLPCPWQAEADTGSQCRACLDQDEFRFAHQIHKGGYIPAALAAYMAQPHVLYIATFAGGASKVGTAAEPRRTSRLDEQGPMCASYLAAAADGRAVRFLEDALSRALDITQTVRGSAKLSALVDADADQCSTEHDQVLGNALPVLVNMGIEPSRQEWNPPPEGLDLRSAQRLGQRAVYPHDLREGEHGFSVTSCSGSNVLVRTSPGDHDIRYVMNLNALKGRRVQLGDYTSSAATLQSALF